MKKNEFLYEVRRRIGDTNCITRVHCILWSTFDFDGNSTFMVEVTAYGGTGFGFRLLDMFSSDYIYDIKEARKLAKYWERKVKGWLNPNLGVSVVYEELNL